MRTKLLFGFIILALSPIPCALSQVPQGFNYQAIVRNTAGLVIQTQPVKIMVSIQTLAGTVFWNEEHSLTTTQFGLASFIIGDGPNVSGIVTNFSMIDWNAQALYLRTQVQYPVGSPYTDMGTTQIWSVPYSLVAKDVEGPVGKLDIKPQVLSNDTALFEVINKDGNTVFAVYNEGVRVHVADDTKGKKGGFAVGGFGSDKAESQPYMIVTADSIRMYLDSNTDTKSTKKGGFAVGGFDMAKGTSEAQTYLDVSKDSVRIYIDSNPLTKKPKGGFAVGGYDLSKGIIAQSYLDISADSIRMYIDDSQKGKKGGFAVGSFDMSKGGSKYLRVTNDSTRVYVSDVTKVGSLGGFAVKPLVSATQKTDFFNVTNAATAEIIKNEPRVMWYSKKSALIGGEVHVGSPDSVGQNSTALGYRSIARGNQSQAFGYRSLAYGSYSTAIGYKAESNTNGMAVGYLAKASGSDAFALGSGALAIANKSFAFGSVGIDSLGNVTGNTQATGEYAYAFGLGSVASGRGSFAIGANDTANFDFATAIGYKTKAGNWYAVAMGSYSQATGRYSTSIGYRNKSTGDASTTFGRYSEATMSNALASGYQSKATGANATAIGYRALASASGAVAVGYLTTASQSGSAAFGRQTTASGAYSLAAGYSSTSAGMYSIAGGYLTRAMGPYSVSFGRESWAGGDYGVTLGYWTKAPAYCATAVGYHTKATGQFSFAAGYETSSRAFESFVIGRWNDSISTSATDSWVVTDPLFVVGNGAASTSVNNAFVVFKNGNAKVDGNFYPNDDNSNTLGLSTNRWTTVYATTGTINTSDAREKTDIMKLSYGLNEVLQLHPVSFKWKDHPEMGNYLGLIAQEVQPVIREIVDVGTDQNNTLGINYSSLIPVLINSIQEQQEEIEDLRTKNHELEAKLSEIIHRLDNLDK